MTNPIKNKVFVLIAILLTIPSAFILYKKVYLFDQIDLVQKELANFTILCDKPRKGSDKSIMWLESPSIEKVSSIEKVRNCLSYETKVYDKAIVSYSDKVMYNLIVDDEVIISKEDVYSYIKVFAPLSIIFMFCFSYAFYFFIKDTIAGWQSMARKKN